MDAKKEEKTLMYTGQYLECSCGILVARVLLHFLHLTQDALYRGVVGAVAFHLFSRFVLAVCFLAPLSLLAKLTKGKVWETHFLRRNSQGK
jgi:hypothetical protein